MNSGSLLLTTIALTIAVCVGNAGSLYAQNDWGNPVEKELPPRTTSRQSLNSAAQGPTDAVPIVQVPASTRQHSGNHTHHSNQRSATRSPQRPTQKPAQRQFQQPPLQFRPPSIPRSPQRSVRHAPAAQRNRRPAGSRGTGVTHIPALTPANLFGVRMAAQDIDIQIDTGEEVGGDEIMAEEFGEVIGNEAGEDFDDGEFDDSDIYYEDADESVEVADNYLMGDSVLEDSDLYDSSGCADCGFECQSCGQSGGSCIRCRNGGLFVGGIGTYSIRPSWETNPAFFVGNGATTAASTNRTGRQFDWDTTLSPYAWLGIKGSSGFGLRGRFWMFDNDTTTNYSVLPGTSITSANASGLSLFAGPGSQVFAEHELEFYSSDIEFSFEKQNERWGIEGAAGVRYLDIDQNYILRSTAAGGASNQLQTAHHFDGFGPTLQVKANHALGLLGMSVFASGRESILFGDRRSSVVSNAATRAQSGKGVVSITELEVGIQRVVWFRRVSTDFQIGLVGQFWNGVGNAANGGLFDSSRDQSMGLFGGRASLGLNF